MDGVDVTALGVTLCLTGGDQIDAEVVLVAIGRGPSSGGLGLDENGIRLDDRGFVAVDDRLRTTAKDVYAVGDVVGGLQLAHRGFAHGIFVAESLAGLDPLSVNDTLVPG